MFKLTLFVYLILYITFKLFINTIAFLIIFYFIVILLDYLLYL